MLGLQKNCGKGMPRQSQSIAFKSARRHVRFYARQSQLMERHEEAMECRDCEDFLQLGIDALKWLQRAEEELRLSVYSGERLNSVELSDGLDRLYHVWLMPVHSAEQWIAAQAARGYTPDNIHEFRHACEQAREIVENRDWSRVSECSRSIQPAEDW
jgi:hypothetical protein